MSATAADAPGFPLRTTSDREPKLFELSVIATAAGAIVSPALKVSDNNLSITKNGGTTGQYDLVFPPAGSPNGFAGRAFIDVVFYSTAGTVNSYYVKARNFAAGTASIVCTTPAGVAAYLASGDELDIQVWVDGKPGK